MKLIITCGGKPMMNGSKRRTFLWSEVQQCYIHENRELTPEEFNRIAPEVFKRNADLRPCARVLTPDTATTPDEIKTAVLAPVTLEAALAVVEKLAPERLKKKMGRPPSVPQMAMET